MTLVSLLTTAAKNLKTVTATAQLEAELLLSFVLNKPRSFLYTWPDTKIDEAKQQQFTLLLEERLKGLPIAYLLGEKEFWSLPLTVTPDVLIPRPETELLVETTLSLLDPQASLAVADLGTGSGAIAIALAHERPTWQITATDASTAALEVAQRNAQRHGVSNRIHFKQGAWLQACDREQRFHAIVSNPPYIASDDLHLRQGDVRFEPKQALVAENQGLADLENIIQQARDYLHPKGWLLLEYGFDQSPAVQKILHSCGYLEIQSLADLNGILRITLGCYFKTQ